MSAGLYDRVYALVRQIPAGSAATYGQIALLLGNPRMSRAVGFALGACRDPSVPCHRGMCGSGPVPLVRARFPRRHPGILMEFATNRCKTTAFGV